MTGARREPLTREERELADRLARLGAAGEPSAALDSRILAAAHGAVAARPRNRRPRWPLAFGAVATLALAIGIAWQLRPSQEQVQVYSEAPAAARATRSSGPSATEELPVAAVVAPQVASAPALPDPASEAAEPPAEAQQPRATTRQAAERAKSGAEEERDAFPAPERSQAGGTPAPPPPPPPDAQDIVFEAAAPVDAPPTQAPAAPPTPAPANAVENAAVADTAARVKRESAAEAKSAADEETALDQITVNGTRVERDAAGFEDQAIDDQPPATADSPAVQRAWLQQIRELVADGEIDAARESLAEFKRRYPHYALPDDLAEFAP
jgi:hypothetical protein